MEKELVWESALCKKTKLSEIDHQYLSNIIWFNEVFHGRTRYNCKVQYELEYELWKRFPKDDNNGVRLQWKPLPLPEEIKWIKRECVVNMDNGNIYWQDNHIGGLSHIKKWNKPLTFKEKVLRFVESKGTATFTEIQEFAVDLNFGKGTYQQGQKETEILVFNFTTRIYDKKIIKTNKHRGQYCSHIFGWENYWMKGTSRLKRVKRGVYTVIRD